MALLRRNFDKEYLVGIDGRIFVYMGSWVVLEGVSWVIWGRVWELVFGEERVEGLKGGRVEFLD